MAPCRKQRLRAIAIPLATGVALVHGARRAALADGTWPRAKQRRYASALLFGMPLSGANYMSTMYVDMDTNKDGYVDMEEFFDGMISMLDETGMKKKHVRSATLNYLRELYKASDMDGDGVLNQSEFAFGNHLAGEDAVANKRREEPDRGARAARAELQVLDTDGDGAVSEAELAAAWRGSLSDFGLGRRSNDFDGWTSMYFALANGRGSGSLDWRELQYANFLCGEHVAKEQASELFEEMDRNHDGRVEAWEVEDRIEHFRRERADLGLRIAKRVREHFDVADHDGDGAIDRAEGWHLAALTLGSFADPTS